MKIRIAAIAVLLMLPLVAFGGEKYPLSMTAVYTRGHIDKDKAGSKEATFHSGDYDCTAGDANNSPDCKTTLEWAELDTIAGTPTTVVFTMADGTVVRVQSLTVKKLPGYIVCTEANSAFSSSENYVVYCNLYFKLLGVTLEGLKSSRTETVNGYKQEVALSSDEMTKASQDYDKKLFGTGDSFMATIRYKLKGKPTTSVCDYLCSGPVKHMGGQTIEVPVDRFPSSTEEPPIVGQYFPSTPTP